MLRKWLLHEDFSLSMLCVKSPDMMSDKSVKNDVMTAIAD